MRHIPYLLLIRPTLWLGQLHVDLKHLTLAGEWWSPLAFMAWGVTRFVLCGLFAVCVWSSQVDVV